MIEEYIFSGTPSDFALLASSVIRHHRNAFRDWGGMATPFDVTLPERDAMEFTLDFTRFQSGLRGQVVVRIEPGGAESRVVVYPTGDDWADCPTTDGWAMVHTEAERRGVIRLATDAPTSPTSGTGGGKGEPGEQAQPAPNTLRFELIFNGTPARFGLLVRDLKQRIREESGVLEWRIDRDPFTVYPVALSPDVPEVDVTFGDPNSEDTAICGHVTAQSLRDGKALLIVSAEKESWPSLAQWWGSIRAEAERLGFLDAQPMQVGRTPIRKETLVRLRKNLVEWFNDSELRDLCFDMGVDYEILSGDNKAEKARELVAYCERRQIIPDLVAKCRELRPKVSWEGEYE